jgi:hypothetical protein
MGIGPDKINFINFNHKIWIVGGKTKIRNGIVACK